MKLRAKDLVCINQRATAQKIENSRPAALLGCIMYGPISHGVDANGSSVQGEEKSRGKRGIIMCILSTCLQSSGSGE